MKKYILSIFSVFVFSILLTSCASVMNLHNTGSWQMGIDIVTTNASPVTVVANGYTCKTKVQYSGDHYHVTRALLTHPKRKMSLDITQNNVTRHIDLNCKKVRGLFWIEGLFVIIDHIKGTLIKYPAVEYDLLPVK